MALFFEDREKVSKKQIPIPKEANVEFKKMALKYKPYLDQNVSGSKILKSLASDKKYNKKGENASQNGQNANTVSVGDAKMRLHRQEKFPQGSVGYELYGGQLAHDILKKGVESARATKEVEAVKPPKITAQNAKKQPNSKNKTISVPNGKISFTTTNENRMINEEICETVWDVFNEYDTNYVLNEFLKHEEGQTQNWLPLINPTMYKQALVEFTKYGKFIKFPTKYIYQWMGIILRNTAKLESNTKLAGHTNSPIYQDDVEYALSNYFNGRNFEVDHSDLKYEITLDELKTLCGKLDEEYSIHNDGQLNALLTQKEVNQQDAIAKNKEYSQYINYYNQNKPKYKDDKIIIDGDDGKFYRIVSIYQFLDELGLYDWMVMPDGSDAYSDFGLKPLFNIFEEYNDDMTPEETIVLVNKALDVWHHRGDMSSIFIQGGSYALDRIAESVNKNKKTLFITETQVKKLKELWQNE